MQLCLRQIMAYFAQVFKEYGTRPILESPAHMEQRSGTNSQNASALTTSPQVRVESFCQTLK